MDLTQGHSKVMVFGGTLMSALGNLHLQDFGRTIILAAVGAVVSYFVSLLLKRITRKP